MIPKCLSFCVALGTKIGDFREPDTHDLTLIYLVIFLCGILCRFQHCAGHITTSTFDGRGNQNIMLVKVPYCKLPTIGKQLPTFPLKVWSLNRRLQR